jgi:hypothetical protein
MEKKQFPLEQMRTTAQQMLDEADLFAQELHMRMGRLAAIELCLPPTQKTLLEDLTTTMRTNLATLNTAENHLAESLQTAADAIATTDRSDVAGFVAQ